jgi:hypothetical protein
VRSMILNTAAVFLIFSTPMLPTRAEAAELNGNDLLAVCQDNRQEMIHWCRGYILGITDVMFDSYLTPISACPSAGIPQQQLVDIVVKQLKEFPEQRHASAKYLVAGSLLKAFPCPANSGAKQ